MENKIPVIVNHMPIMVVMVRHNTDHRLLAQESRQFVQLVDAGPDQLPRCLYVPLRISFFQQCWRPGSATSPLFEKSLQIHILHNMHFLT
jgi:hypothetical protein